MQETVKDGNILRGWDGYLGKQASSGAIRRINRFREADRMFSASSVTSSGQSGFVGKKVTCCQFSCSPDELVVARAQLRRALRAVVPQGQAADASSSSGAKIKKLRKRGREESNSNAQE